MFRMAWFVSQNRRAMVGSAFQVQPSWHNIPILTDSAKSNNWLIIQSSWLAVGCCWWHRPCGWRLTGDFPGLTPRTGRETCGFCKAFGRGARRFSGLTRSLGRMLSATTGSGNDQLSAFKYNWKQDPKMINSFPGPVFLSVLFLLPKRATSGNLLRLTRNQRLFQAQE